MSHPYTKRESRRHGTCSRLTLKGDNPIPLGSGSLRFLVGTDHYVVVVFGSTAASKQKSGNKACDLQSRTKWTKMAAEIDVNTARPELSFLTTCFTHDLCLLSSSFPSPGLPLPTSLGPTGRRSGLRSQQLGEERVSGAAVSSSHPLPPHPLVSPCGISVCPIFGPNMVPRSPFLPFPAGTVSRAQHVNLL